MTDTPIDRESVEPAARWLRATGQDQAADTLLALRAALDEAEARAKRLEAMFEKLQPRPDEDYVTLDYLDHTSVYDWPAWVSGDMPIVPIQNLRAVESERDSLLAKIQENKNG